MNRIFRFAVTIDIIGRVIFYYLIGARGRMYSALYGGFMDLGGVYVKFLQILSLQSGFFEGWEDERKLMVYDQVEADKLDIYKLLNSQLSPEQRARIVAVSDEPFAGGSFGQVYSARLNDGTAVIIKALRPPLKKYLSFDLKMLRILSRIIGFVSPSSALDMREIFRDFRRVVINETDYEREAEYASRFYHDYQNHPNIHIPKTYIELSSPMMIVQDFVGGVSATQLIAMRDQGIDINNYVRETLGSDLVKQVESLGFEMLYGVFHAENVQGDPHPGNIKIMPGNRVGIIDFGIMATPPENKVAFLDIVRDYTQIYRGDFDPGRFSVNALRFYAPDLYIAFNTFKSMGNPANPESGEEFDIMKEIENLARQAFEQNKGKVDARQMIEKGQFNHLFSTTVNEGNRFAISISFDGGVMLRAAAAFMALAENLGVRQEIFPQVFDEVIQEVEGSASLLQAGKQTTDVDTALETIAAWVEDISERDPLFFRGLIAKIRRRVNV